jgi:hypothetical protein
MPPTLSAIVVGIGSCCGRADVGNAEIMKQLRKSGAIVNGDFTVILQ